jgi:hypothetical protein
VGHDAQKTPFHILHPPPHLPWMTTGIGIYIEEEWKREEKSRNKLHEKRNKKQKIKNKKRKFKQLLI